ncbi:MAG: hypothetical protein AAB932_03430 [Patescibacteria group bacterium]
MEKDTQTLDRYVGKAHEKFKPKHTYISSLVRGQKTLDVQYWNFLSKDPGYQALLVQLRNALQRFENYYLKKEVLQVTIFGFGARLRKNFTKSFVDFVFDKNFYRYMETLSEYTITEVAATLHLAKRGWVKAGHDEEKLYDELTAMCYDRFHDEFLQGVEKPEFYYI